MSNPVQPLPPAEFQAAFDPDKNYFRRAAVSLDDMVNALLDGNNDETISSRMARWATEHGGWKRDVGAAVCRGLNILSADHGAKAEAADLGRAELIVKTEEATPTVQQEGQ